MDLQQKITNKLGVDKIMHFLAGGWFGFIPDWQLAIVSGVIVWGCKELIYDKGIKKSKFDWIDYAASMLGVVLGTGLRVGVGMIG